MVDVGWLVGLFDLAATCKMGGCLFNLGVSWCILMFLSLIDF
jgi:hypothetical protein